MKSLKQVGDSNPRPEQVSTLTSDKAVEYLDVVLEAHPRLRPGDFGQAVKLGQEALAELLRLRKTIPILKDTLLPSEDPK
ncbi:hypothetical protein ES705_16172 [subsurface metagenome]